MSRVQFKNPAERIIVALDVDDLSEAKKIVEELKDFNVTFKVGNQLGTFEGWQKVIELIHSTDAKIFCDTKFKDIPITVEKSARAITRHQPDFFNIMADNSVAALVGAVDGVKTAVSEFNLSVHPILLGVTVITSISDDGSEEIYGAPSAQKVLQFARVSAEAGLNGVVCSAQEAKILSSNPETRDLLLVTPGIRPSWAVSNDQKRIVTPADAVRAGADYLVIGRPITQPPAEIGSRRKALELVIEELKEF